MRTIGSYSLIQRGGTAQQMAHAIWHLYWCNPALRLIGIAMLLFMGAMSTWMMSIVNDAPDGSASDSLVLGLSFGLLVFEALFVGVQFGGPYLVAMRSERRSMVILPLRASQRRLVLWLACVVAPAGVIFACMLVLQVLFAAAINNHGELAAISAYTALLVLGLRALAFQVAERTASIAGWAILRGFASWHVLPGFVLVAALIATLLGGFVFEALPTLAAFSVAVAVWALFVQPQDVQRAYYASVTRPAFSSKGAQSEIRRCLAWSLGYGVYMGALTVPFYFIDSSVAPGMFAIVAPGMGAALGMQFLARLRGLRVLPIRTSTLAWAFLALSFLAVLLPAIMAGLMVEPEIEQMRRDEYSDTSIAKFTNLKSANWQHRVALTVSTAVLVAGGLSCMFWFTIYGMPLMLLIIGTMFLSFSCILTLRWDPLSFQASALNLSLGIPMLACATWGLHKYYFWKSTPYKSLSVNSPPRIIRPAEPDFFSRFLIPLLLVIMVGLNIFVRSDAVKEWRNDLPEEVLETLPQEVAASRSQVPDRRGSGPGTTKLSLRLTCDTESE